MKEALAYSRALASLAGDPALPPGLGPVSIYGGRLEGQGRELRELFRCALCRCSLWTACSVRCTLDYCITMIYIDIFYVHGLDSYCTECPSERTTMCCFHALHMA